MERTRAAASAASDAAADNPDGRQDDTASRTPVAPANRAGADVPVDGAADDRAVDARTVDDALPITAPDTPQALHARHFGDLVRVAALLTDDRFLAEEIVQEAFAGLITHWDRIDQGRALGYLYRAVANGSKSALRRRRTVRANPSGPPGTIPGADTRVLREAGHDALLRAIATLPARQRQVVVLRYFSELSIAETATALDLSPAAVTAAAYRAVTSLARHREEFR